MGGEKLTAPVSDAEFVFEIGELLRENYDISLTPVNEAFDASKFKEKVNEIWEKLKTFVKTVCLKLITTVTNKLNKKDKLTARALIEFRNYKGDLEEQPLIKGKCITLKEDPFKNFNDLYTKRFDIVARRYNEIVKTRDFDKFDDVHFKEVLMPENTKDDIKSCFYEEYLSSDSKSLSDGHRAMIAAIIDNPKSFLNGIKSTQSSMLTYVSKLKDSTFYPYNVDDKDVDHLASTCITIMDSIAKEFSKYVHDMSYFALQYVSYCQWVFNWWRKKYFVGPTISELDNQKYNGKDITYVKKAK